MKKRSKHISVYVDEDIADWLQSIAIKLGISVSSLIKMWIKEKFNKWERGELSFY